MNPSDKLRKLLALAARAGTAEEAATAAAMAVQIARKHQLDLDPQDIDASPIHRLCVPGRNRWRWHTSLWAVLGPVHGCVVLLGRQGFYAAGRPHDIDTLMVVYEHLAYQIRSVMRSQQVPSSARASFGLGCVDAIGARLKDTLDAGCSPSDPAADPAALGASSEDAALVRVFSERETESRRYAATVFDIAKARPREKVKVEREMYEKGWRAGSEMPLSPQKGIA